MSHPTITPVHELTYEPIVSALEEVLMQLPMSACPALVGELERLKSLALVRIMVERGATTTNDSDVLTIPEVARRLKISKYRAYELARQGILKPIRVGRSVRVETRELTNYLLQRGH